MRVHPLTSSEAKSRNTYMYKDPILAVQLVDSNNILTFKKDDDNIFEGVGLQDGFGCTQMSTTWKDTRT